MHDFAIRPLTLAYRQIELINIGRARAAAALAVAGPNGHGPAGQTSVRKDNKLCAMSLRDFFPEPARPTVDPARKRSHNVAGAKVVKLFRTFAAVNKYAIAYPYLECLFIGFSSGTVWCSASSAGLST